MLFRSPAVAPEVPPGCSFEEYDSDSPGSHNYCGTGWADVPDFFPKCCSDHDNCYAGFRPDGTRLSPVGHPIPGGREACDDAFLACMKSKCDEVHHCPIKNFGCHVVATAYYFGVRVFGRGAFCHCRIESDPADCGGLTLQTAVGLLGSAVMP